MKIIPHKETIDILKQEFAIDLKNGNSVLDIGCNFPKLLFDLHHNFNFKECIGVDKRNTYGLDRIGTCEEIDAIIENKENNGELTSGEIFNINAFAGDEKNWLYEYCYKNICKYQYNVNPHQKEIFQNIFSLNFDTKIEDFLKNLDQKFDLIVCSKVLSHLDFNIDPIDILKIIISKLNKNGLIIFRDNDESWKEGAQIKQPFDTKKLLDEIDLIFDYGPFKEENVNKTHILFAGRKK